MNAHNANVAIRLTASLALFALAAAANAEDTTLDVMQVRAGLTTECAAPRVPGFIEIGRIFSVANAGQAYALRSKIQLLVTRACHGGVKRVLITWAQDASPDMLPQLLAVAR